jgi:hypothetical protein
MLIINKIFENQGTVPLSSRVKITCVLSQLSRYLGISVKSFNSVMFVCKNSEKRSNIMPKKSKKAISSRANICKHIANVAKRKLEHETKLADDLKRLEEEYGISLDDKTERDDDDDDYDDDTIEFIHDDEVDVIDLVEDVIENKNIEIVMRSNQKWCNKWKEAGSNYSNSGFCNCFFHVYCIC